MKWILFAALAMSASAQQSTRIVQVDYMKVAPGKTAEYVKAEEAIKTAVHQDRVKKGMINSWSLYSVRFPSGTSREFDYATVTVYADMSKLERSFDAGHRKSMRDTGVSQMRSLLRSDVLSPFVSAGAMEAEWPWLTVSYVKAKPGMMADWRADESEAWKEVAEAQIKGGSLKAWVASSVVWPAGSSREYDFVSVNARETFMQKRTPGTETLSSRAANRSARHGEAIRREMWHLVSHTAPR